MSHIEGLYMASMDHHGCLHLQVVLRRQGQGWARGSRQGQQTRYAQLIMAPGSAMPAASRTRLPRGHSTKEPGALSRCCFPA